MLNYFCVSGTCTKDTLLGCGFPLKLTMHLVEFLLWCDDSLRFFIAWSVAIAGCARVLQYNYHTSITYMAKHFVFIILRKHSKYINFKIRKGTLHSHLNHEIAIGCL